MEIGFISPIGMLDKYATGNVQYCLPSLYLSNKTYKDFYLWRKTKKEKIILDCKKLGWKRQPEDFLTIQEVINELQPNYVIAPSCMFNADKTFAIFQEFIDQIVLGHSHEVACLEGTNLKEVLDLKRKLKGNLFAIPSHLYNIVLGTKEIDWSKEYFFIDNHKTCDELFGKKGTLVTSLPIRLGLEGRLLSNNLPAPPSLNFHEDKDKYPMIVNSNIKETLKMYSGVN